MVDSIFKPKPPVPPTPTRHLKIPIDCRKWVDGHQDRVLPRLLAVALFNGPDKEWTLTTLAEAMGMEPGDLIGPLEFLTAECCANDDDYSYDERYDYLKEVKARGRDKFRLHPGARIFTSVMDNLFELMKEIDEDSRPQPWD